MNYTKKILALLLALTMVFAMAVTVGADEDVTKPGSITINNAVVGQTYKVYKILELESYNATSGAYSYKATSEWKNFVEGTDIKDVYLKTDDQGYVTWVENASAENFAAAARAYAADENNSISATKSATATATDAITTNVTIDDLELGYYLVDSTLGALCALDTTNTSMTVNEKNTAPTIEKQVQEDSTEEWGNKNDADIGQTVNFKTTVHAKKDGKNYVVHDKMSAGLTLKDDSIVVKAGETNLTKDTDYTVSTTCTDNCTFEITFTETYLNSITGDTDIVITYSATVNATAVIASTGNPNETWLTYSESSRTEHHETRTYVWEMKVFKYTEKGDDKSETPLAGAEFKLYKEVGDQKTKNYVTATEIKDESNKVTGYKVTGWTTTESEATTFVSPDTGKFDIVGLDADTYKLTETKAPDGYNKLSGDITIVISKEYGGTDGNTGTATVTYNTSSTGEVKVLNQTGTELPSTGGIGTTIFYVLGSALVLAAVVLLVTKKRMNAENA